MCNELGLKYELVTVNLMAGEQKSPEYIENKHPFGIIPVLVVRKPSDCPSSERH